MSNSASVVNADADLQMFKMGAAARYKERNVKPELANVAFDLMMGKLAASAVRTTKIASIQDSIRGIIKQAGCGGKKKGKAKLALRRK